MVLVQDCSRTTQERAPTIRRLRWWLCTLAKRNRVLPTTINLNDLFSRAEALLNGSEVILQRASEHGDARLALMGVKEVRGCIDLLARMRIAASSVDPDSALTRRRLQRLFRLDARQVDGVCELLGDVLGRWHHLALTVAGGLRDLGLDDAAATVLKDVPETLHRPGRAIAEVQRTTAPLRLLTTNDFSAIARAILEELTVTTRSEIGSLHDCA